MLSIPCWFLLHMMMSFVCQQTDYHKTTEQADDRLSRLPGVLFTFYDARIKNQHDEKGNPEFEQILQNNAVHPNVDLQAGAEEEWGK